MKQTQHPLHIQAVALSRKYLVAEAELMKVLSQIDREKLFREFGYNSTFQYALSLGLTESQAYALITVSRKCDEVPELKEAVLTGALSVGKARRIAPVIEVENSQKWIEAARTLTCHEIERKVVETKPEVVQAARIKPIAASVSRLTMTISQALEEKLKRLQNVLSQKKKAFASLEETVAFALESALRTHDPVERAKRHAARRNSVPKLDSKVPAATQEVCVAGPSGK